jgi:polyketide cyclase/dehydrase/lipid transport protein
VLKVEISSEVKRPVEEVFAYCTDPAKAREWRSGVLECRAEPPGPIQVGSKIHTVLRFLGRRIEGTAEVTELVQNKKLVQKTNSPFPLELTYLAERAADGTKVTVGAVGEPGGFFKVAESVLVRIVKKQGRAELEALKERLEAREPTNVGN